MTDICETSIDLKTWAESIAFIARDGVPASDKIVKAIEDELRIIARKYEQIGDRDGWWKERERQIKLQEEGSDKYSNGQVSHITIKPYSQESKVYQGISATYNVEEKEGREQHYDACMKGFTYFHASGCDCGLCRYGVTE